MKSLTILLVGTLLGAASVGHADTTWVAGGNVSGDWTATGSPYILGNNVTIQPGDTLIIYEGVRIFMHGPYAFVVHGTFKALGSEEHTITFTCDTLQTTNGWRGIQALVSESPIELSRCTIEFIGGTYPSGGVYCEACSVLVDHSTFRYAFSTRGGGINARYGSYVRLESCLMERNGHGGGCGSAINADDSSRIELWSCTIKNNNSLDGGAFCLDGADMLMHDCRIIENRGGIWGGVFFAEESTTIEAYDCVFQGNHATTGGVFYGAGLSPRLTFEGCQFYGNYVPSGTNAASVLNAASVMNIDRCTFVANGPGQYGAVNAGGQCTIRNSIFADQQQQAAVYSSTGNLQVAYCDFFENEGGDVTNITPMFFGIVDTVNANGDPADHLSNIFLNPLFVDTAGDDYHLTLASPCVDAGDPLTLDPDGTPGDIGALYFEQLESAEDVFTSHPLSFTLSAYPNPFNPTTTISFELRDAAEVTLQVFDLLGREVAVLVNGRRDAGTYSVAFDAASLASGLYLCQLRAGDFVADRKLIVLK